MIINFKMYEFKRCSMKKEFFILLFTAFISSGARYVEGVAHNESAILDSSFTLNNVKRKSIRTFHSSKKSTQRGLESGRDLQEILVIEPFKLRINAGSTENFIETDGTIWEKDRYYAGNGDIYSKCPIEIDGTDLDTLYCKERYFNKWIHNKPFRYEIPVPRNGVYQVKLHFAEINYDKAGERIFSVWVGGNLAIKNLDIYTEVGYRKALVVPVTTKTSTGVVSIEMTPKIENPKICAIEVIEIQNYIDPPTEAPIKRAFVTRISAGASESWEDDNGRTWDSDRYFGSNGDVHWVCPLQIEGTELDNLYCKERYFNKWKYNGPFRYDIPVPQNGAYTVKLHFAETTHTSDNQRVFRVKVGGVVVRKALDIFKEVGYATALIIPAETVSLNGIVSIELIPLTENPKICAIEVMENQDVVVPPTIAPVFEKRISAGASENWEDDNGLVWESDQNYDGNGGVYWACPKDIVGTDLDNLYCKERYFNRWVHKSPFRYVIPVPRIGFYSVKLYFAEKVFQARGERIFDVLVGGKVTLGSLDIFAEAGYLTAYVLPVISYTSNGFVTIEFVPKVENPQISAIEIIELPNYLPAPTAAPVAKPFDILINSGGVANYISRSDGRVWLADQYFIGGGVLFKRHHDILYTVNDEVYHIERHGEFRYEIPVPPGTYELILHQAELHWWEVGKRLFDIKIEDETHFKNIDLFKMAGWAQTSFRMHHTLVVTDGLLSLEFMYSTPRVDMPKLSGVEVRYISAATEKIKAFPLHINCGGEDYTDLATGIQWKADINFIRGTILQVAEPRVLALENQIYRTLRYGNQRYEIPAPPGTYEVTLYFAEIWFNEANKRLFNILVEDVLVFPNVDMFTLAGGSCIPFTLKHEVIVTDGLLSIALQDIVPHGYISGIEVNSVKRATMAPTMMKTQAPSRAPVIGSGIVIPTDTVPRQCKIPQLTSKVWTKPLAQYPIIVAEPSGDIIGNDMVIFSGFQNGYATATAETYSLDLSVPTAVWKRMDDMPFPAGITHQAVVVVGTKAYMCGGYIGGSLGLHTDKCFVFDNSVQPGLNQQWSTIAPIPMGGRAGGAMIYDSTLHALIFAGGAQRNTPGQYVAIDYKESWMYSLHNPDAGWVPQSNIPFYANHVNAVTALDSTGKERHFIFGGQVGDYEPTGNIATMYEYVATTDKWIKRTSMPFARGHATSAVRAVGCGFIVAGGRTNKDVTGGLTGEITYYDITTDTWQSIGRLPVDIHTNVCVISKTGLLRCETGWIANSFSTQIQLEL